MKAQLTNDSRSSNLAGAQWPKIKRQIYARFIERMNEISECKAFSVEFCAELNPDVIVINTSPCFALEPQNQRALDWLRRRRGLSREPARARERIAFPLGAKQKIIEDLRADGFQVSG